MITTAKTTNLCRHYRDHHSTGRDDVSVASSHSEQPPLRFFDDMTIVTMKNPCFLRNGMRRNELDQRRTKAGQRRGA